MGILLWRLSSMPVVERLPTCSSIGMFQRFYRHKHITDRCMGCGHEVLSPLWLKGQPTCRGFKFGYAYIEAAPYLVGQALPSLLPGHPEVTPPRPACNL